MSKGIHKGELARERLLAMQQNGQGVAAMREVNEAGAGNVSPHFTRRHADQVNGAATAPSGTPIADSHSRLGGGPSPRQPAVA